MIKLHYAVEFLHDLLYALGHIERKQKNCFSHLLMSFKIENVDRTRSDKNVGLWHAVVNICN